MCRSTLWPLVAVSLTVAILGFVGCNSQPPASPPPTVVKPAAGPKAPPAPGDGLFPGPAKPAGYLIVSGEQLGYLEPCGCTKGQLGGLGRRYDLIEKLRAKGSPLALIDLGSFADPPDARGGPVESKVKFSIALRAFTAMSYDAVALSAHDLRQGIGETLGQYVNLSEKPKIVAANVVPAAGLESAITPAVRATAGPVTLGITAVLDPARYKSLTDPEADQLTVKDQAEVLPGVLADLEKDTSIQVLMVQAAPKRARELARELPGFDLVVSTSDVADPDPDPVVLNDGKTLLIQVGQKGKHVGVVGLFPDQPERLRFKLVHLDPKFEQAEPMRKLIDEEYQNELKELKVVEDFPKHSNLAGAPGATYIGAESCKACHPGTFAKWRSTKHSIAYDDIEKKKHQFDADCVSCHTTGFEYTSGYVSAELTPYLRGNQCENCHGPGSKHAAEPDSPEYRKFMRQSVANADQNRLCLKCHDDDNSPDFKFDKYYQQIVHMKEDRYDDPKVHQGITPSVAAQSR